MFVEEINGLDNKEAYTSFILTHLPVHDFLEHFRSAFPLALALDTVSPSVRSEATAGYYVSHTAVTKGLSSSNIQVA